MAIAPYYNVQGMTEPALMGEFKLSTGAWFNYSARPADDRNGVWPEFPHRVFTCDGDRAALVKKTVAYVVIDETADGAPVVEKWALVSPRAYTF